MEDNNREIIKLLTTIHDAYKLIVNLDEPLKEQVATYLEQCQEELSMRLHEHGEARLKNKLDSETVFDLPDPYLSLTAISAVSDIWGDAK